MSWLTNLLASGITQLTGDVSTAQGSGVQVATVVSIRGATVPASPTIGQIGQVLTVTAAGVLGYSAVGSTAPNVLTGAGNLVAGPNILDTSAGAFTAAMPGGAAVGTVVRVKDKASGIWSTNVPSISVGAGVSIEKIGKRDQFTTNGSLLLPPISNAWYEWTLDASSNWLLTGMSPTPASVQKFNSSGDTDPNVGGGSFFAHFYGPDQLAIADCSSGAITLIPDASPPDGQIWTVKDMGLSGAPAPTWPTHACSVQTANATYWELPSAPGTYAYSALGTTFALPQYPSASYTWRFVKDHSTWVLA